MCSFWHALGTQAITQIEVFTWQYKTATHVKRLFDALVTQKSIKMATNCDKFIVNHQRIDKKENEDEVINISDVLFLVQVKL